jgi:hypothetical protein
MAYQTPPILFIIFNRPSTTEIVFEEIRKAKPRQLFVAADGPRKHKEGELEKCLNARAIISKVDWECEVKTRFRDENLGCGRGPADAISWFFDNVEEGIILEDDIKPSPAFFRFCAELLEYYRDDVRVMEIAGCSLPNKFSKASPYSYFFSDWDYVWGWATWRRAWKHFDYAIKSYPEVRGNFKNTYTSIYEQHHMEHMLNRSYYENDALTWWDPQWTFSRRINSGLVIAPTRNMIVNLGLGSDGTNTINFSSDFGEMKIEEMEFPLKHPSVVMQDRVIDREIFIKYSTTVFSRFRSRLRNILPGWVYGFLKKSLKKV